MRPLLRLPMLRLPWAKPLPMPLTRLPLLRPMPLLPLAKPPRTPLLRRLRLLRIDRSDQCVVPPSGGMNKGPVGCKPARAFCWD